MIGDKNIEAVPEDSVLEAPGRATRRRVKNMMPLPAVSGYDPFDEGHDDGQVEMLYDPATADGEGEAEVDIAELDTEENREVLERIKRGFSNFHRLYWDLARDMYRINTGRLYRLAGYKAFEDYVHTELQFSKRKADYLVGVYKYYSIELKSTLADQPEVYNQIVEKAKQIGWTKAERIAKRNVLDSSNAKDLFEQFTEVNERGKLPSTVQIERMVEEAHRSKNEEDRLEADENNNLAKKPAHYTFSAAQWNSVSEALSIAKDICPQQNAKPSTVMAWICGEYVLNYQGDRGKKIDLSTALSKIQELLEVDIIALDRVTHDVKFGSEAAKALKNSPV